MSKAHATLLRLLFTVAILLLGWSLLAWWGAATSPTDRFKFGALGAARIVDFGTDHSTQERCSWHASGQFEQYCRPAEGAATRLFMLKLGAPALLLALFLALAGTFTPRRTVAVAILAVTAFAIVTIAGNAAAALEFAKGRALSVTGSGTTAAVCACGFALAVIAFGARTNQETVTRAV